MVSFNIFRFWLKVSCTVTRPSSLQTDFFFYFAWQRSLFLFSISHPSNFRFFFLTYDILMLYNNTHTYIHTHTHTNYHFLFKSGYTWVLWHVWLWLTLHLFICKNTAYKIYLSPGCGHNRSWKLLKVVCFIWHKWWCIKMSGSNFKVTPK